MGSLLPLDLQSSGTAIHNKRQACGFLRSITGWTTTTNVPVKIFVIYRRTVLARMKADCPLLASENGMEMWSYEDLMMQNKLKAESRNR